MLTRSLPAVPRAATWVHAVAASACVGGLLLLARAGGPWFPLDDAYITLHNSQVLLGRPEWNFPGVPALLGATSLLHLALLALLSLALPAVQALQLLSLLAAAAYVTGIARMALAAGCSTTQALQAALMAALVSYTPYQLLNGLETGLAMAMLAWALAWSLDGHRSRCLPFLLGLLPFTRPDLAAATVLLLAYRWYRHGRAPSQLGYDVCAVLLASAPWLAWQLASTGAWLPATVGAKEAFFASATLPWGVRSWAIVRALHPMTVGLVIGFLYFRRSTPGYFMFGFLLLFLAAYQWSLPYGLHYNEFRYLHVLAPMSFCCLLLAGEGAPHLRLAQAVLLALTVLTLPVTVARYFERQQVMADLDAASRWASANLPRDARLAAHDIGYLSFSTQLQLIDLVGLKDPAAAQVHRRLTLPSTGCQRPQALSTIAQQAGATHLMALVGDPFWEQTLSGLASQGWRMKLLRPASQKPGYEIYALSREGVADAR